MPHKIVGICQHEMKQEKADILLHAASRKKRMRKRCKVEMKVREEQSISDISKCALDDAYISRAEVVCREWSMGGMW